MVWSESGQKWRMRRQGWADHPARDRRARRAVGAWLLLGLAIGAGFSIPATAATFTKLVDSNDSIPAQPGQVFAFPSGVAGTPTVGGGRIVFQSVVNVYLPTLWAVNTDSTALTRLIGYPDPLPGSTNGITRLSPCLIAGGRVVFCGADAPTTLAAGLFSLPLEGGPAVSLVNGNTPIPGTTNNFVPTQFTDFSADNRNVAFAFGGALFSVPIIGGAVNRISTPQARISDTNYLSGGLGAFYMPAVRGPDLAMIAGNAFGQGAVYLAPQNDFDGANGTPVASLEIRVPGDALGRTFNPFGFNDPRYDGGIAVFHGVAGADNGLQGIYSWYAGSLARVADTLTAVPGGAGTFQGIRSLDEFALSAGTVAFYGADSNSRGGIYVAPALGGPVQKVVAIGGFLPGGRTVAGVNGTFPQPVIQAGSLSATQLVLRLDFIDPVPARSGTGIYLVDLAPAPAAPAPEITASSAGSLLVVETPSVLGWVYRLQGATNLVSPILWTDIATSQNGTGEPLQFDYDRSGSMPRQQFFRIAVSAQP